MAIRRCLCRSRRTLPVPARPPSSSQVGFALGVQRGGLLGGIAAFLAFTLPSALFLVMFAIYADTLSGMFGNGLIHGLKIVAAAVVAQAILGMATSLCKTQATATIAVLALLIVTLFSGPLGQSQQLQLEHSLETS